MGYTSAVTAYLVKIISTFVAGLVFLTGSQGRLTLRRDISRQSYNRQILTFQTASGTALDRIIKQKGYVDVNGNAVFSGAVIANGVQLGTGLGTGNVLTLGDRNYVRKQGDTMTGGLRIQKAGVGLTVTGTASGKSLTVMDGTTNLRGVAYQWPLADATAAHQFLVSDASANLSFEAVDSLTALGRSIRNSDLLLVGTGATQYKITRFNFLSGVLGALVYQGTWNASTNSPVLSNATGSKGQYYVASVAGSTDFGAGAISFAINDYAIYNGTAWEKLQNADTVISVFNRQGAVLAAPGDFSGSYVTNKPSGIVSAVTVQAAIDQLGTAVAAKNFGTGNTVTIGDSRYLNTAGDTATGALNVRANLSGSSLNVTGQKACTNLQTSLGGAVTCNNAVYLPTSTGSLKTLFDAQYLRTSTGSLKSLFDSLYFRSSTGSLKTYFDALYFRSSTGSLKTFFDANYLRTSTGALQAKDDNRYARRSGASMTGGLIITNGNPAATIDSNILLELAGIGSGRILRAQDTLASSGALSVKGGVTFTGLSSCTAIQSASNGALSCNNALTTNNFGSGNVLTIANARYVKKQGDTMTGGLLLESSTLHGALPAIDASLLLEVAGSASGRVLHAQDKLESSGTIVVSGRSVGTPMILLSNSGADASMTFQVRDAQVYDLAGTGGLLPATGMDRSDIGTAAWTNPSRIVATDASYATTTPANGAVTHYLTGSGYGFNIPSSALIDGITVSIVRHASSASIFKDNTMRLVKGGAIGTLDHASASLWPNSDGTATYGTGSTDLWGTTWAPSDINNAKFGAAISVKGANGIASLSVDSISITVYYSPLTGKQRSWTVGQHRTDFGKFKISHSTALGTIDYVALNASGSLGIGDTTAIDSSKIPIGSVVIGNGALCIDNGGSTCASAARTAGNIYAKSASITAIDLAENYPTLDRSLSPGELVALDPLHASSVERARSGSLLLGIVSTAPGLLLGDFDVTRPAALPQVPVALAGRAPLRVGGEGGQIRIGDPLTLSSVPGVARRAKAGEQSVGLALEPFSGARGVIAAFLHLTPASGTAELDARIAALEGRVAALEKRLSALSSLLPFLHL